MKYNLLLLDQSQGGLQELSKELNDVDWTAFPIGEHYGVWIPITVVLVVFFGFRYLAEIIEKE
ncbi:hypothetical protein N8873_09795 [Flavobacteriaceae bacterium]|jgi:hypothetical protein|nr:hypothetical protein [Flavobacteriaceae bacterium]